MPRVEVEAKRDPGAVKDPIKALSAFKKKVETVKARAVMQPNFQNVLAYMELQKVLLERSSRFAQTWMEVLYRQPRLDANLKNPFSAVGRLIRTQEDRKTLKAQIRALSNSYGLFFIFSSACSYCKAFAPIVKGFSKKYGWHVLAISIDGSLLPEFPGAINDSSIAYKLGVQALPALLAVHPK